MGELGWMSMLGRRMLLRLTYWGKILSMSKDRLVRQVYEVGRARLETNQNANTWCNLTRKWLRQLGLEESWVKQAVDAQWREVVQRKIMQAEEQRWRRGVLSNARLELYSTWKLRLSLTSEEYLGEQEKNRRRLWTKLRAGCLELRRQVDGSGLQWPECRGWHRGGRGYARYVSWKLRTQNTRC